MRSADSPGYRFHAPVLVTIFLAAGLVACGPAGDGRIASASSLPVNGPQADYPILVGQPYEVAGTTYTPADVLNYDEVGYLALDAGTLGYTGSHHTLPVPSYVEVTSLESGRTVLVRLERRGPMTTNHVVALSPAAMAQLGGNVETPVRVRRVNPPEDHRAMLRGGNAAPLRMDTPATLLSVLARRLPASGSASLAARAEPPAPLERVEIAASSATTADPPVIAAAPVRVGDSLADGSDAQAEIGIVAETVQADTSPSPVSSPVDAEAGFIVQAASFANPDNARRAANRLSGQVWRSGQYYRVGTGPFSTRGEAEASLANVRRAGYSDARILTSG